MTYRSLCFLVLLIACGDDATPVTDAGERSDVPRQDVGSGDSGADTGALDSGALDSGADATEPLDASVPDSAIPDAGSPDVSGPCRPFTADGCESGSWCKPEDDDVSVGVCTRHGDQDPGEVCITSIDCVAGAVCGERAEGGVCDETCDPESPQGSPTNPCASGTRCTNLRDPETGEPIALGICVPGCDFDAGITCSDESLTCEPSELVSGDVDICLPGVTNLPAQGDCALAGIPHGQLCGPGRICLDRDDLRPGNLCYVVCRADVGFLNLDNHPDCNSPSQVCQQFATTLGVCL